MLEFLETWDYSTCEIYLYDLKNKETSINTNVILIQKSCASWIREVSEPCRNHPGLLYCVICFFSMSGKTLQYL